MIDPTRGFAEVNATVMIGVGDEELGVKGIEDIIEEIGTFTGDPKEEEGE